MKVAFLSREYPPDTAWGGIGTGYHSLARALARRGHQVHVICQAAGQPGDLIDDGVFVHRVGTNPKRYSVLARLNYSLHAWLKLRELIRKQGIDIVEATYWGAEGLLYSLRTRAPLVVGIQSAARDIIGTRTYSGMAQLTSLKILSRLEDFTIRRASLVSANSRAMYIEATDRLHIDPGKVEIVHHAVDTEKYRFVASDIRGRLGIPINAPLVLFVGRLEARKGVHILCQAIPEIIKGLPATRFVLLGRDTNTAPEGGSFRSYIAREAEVHGFSNNLILTDFLSQDELVKLYSACDVFVLPSLQEAFGLVVLEAMACGKPVVATATGIVPELGLDGASGIMVPTNDAAELAQAIVKLLRLGEEDKQRIARRNRELVESSFSLPVWADNVVQFYDKALKGGT